MGKAKPNMKSFIVFACVLATALARPEAGYSYSDPSGNSHIHVSGSASGSGPITSYSPPASGSGFSSSQSGGSSFSSSQYQQHSVPAQAPVQQYSAPAPVHHPAPAPQYLAPAPQAPIRSGPAAQYLAPTAPQYVAPIQTVPAPQYLAPVQDTTPYIANHGSSNNFAFSSGSANTGFSGQSSNVAFQQSSNFGTKQYYQNASKYSNISFLPFTVQNLPTIVQKSIYVHVPPPETEYDQVQQSQVNQVVQPRKHYKIIFIKAPAPQPAPTAAQYIAAQQATEEKTIVYVLVKKPEEQIDYQVSASSIPAPPPSKPEVYFIKYKTQPEPQSESIGASQSSGHGVQVPAPVYGPVN